MVHSKIHNTPVNCFDFDFDASGKPPNSCGDAYFCCYGYQMILYKHSSWWAVCLLYDLLSYSCVVGLFPTRTSSGGLGAPNRWIHPEDWLLSPTLFESKPEPVDMPWTWNSESSLVSTSIIELQSWCYHRRVFNQIFFKGPESLAFKILLK